MLKQGASPDAAEYVHYSLKSTVPVNGHNINVISNPPASTAVGLAAWLGSYRQDLNTQENKLKRDVLDNREIMSHLWMLLPT